MATTESTPDLLPIPADVAGGGVIVLLALFQTLVLGGGGTLSFVALLLVWPLIGGGVAAFFSTHPRQDRPVYGAVAGTFAALTATLLVFLSGLAGVWPSFVTAHVGVTLWPVTLVTLVGTTLAWTVFGYLGAAAAEKLV
jgi:hypothetical protein